MKPAGGHPDCEADSQTMDDSRSLRIEYVEARRVLLDALDALRPHLDAVVLIGAQAAISARQDGSRPTSHIQPTQTLCSTRHASSTSHRSANR